MKAWNWNGNKSLEMNEEAKALRDKIPSLHLAVSTYLHYYFQKSSWLWWCACAFLCICKMRHLAGEGCFGFQFIAPAFFFSFPSFRFCRRWHITISGQKSSLLSSPRETVPVSLFRLTSGGALRAFWLNPLSFPLDILYLNTMHGAEPRCVRDFSPPTSPLPHGLLCA